MIFVLIWIQRGCKRRNDKKKAEDKWQWQEWSRPNSTLDCCVCVCVLRGPHDFIMFAFRLVDFYVVVVFGELVAAAVVAAEGGGDGGDGVAVEMHSHGKRWCRLNGLWQKLFFYCSPFTLLLLLGFVFGSLVAQNLLNSHFGMWKGQYNRAQSSPSTLSFSPFLPLQKSLLSFNLR